MDGVYKTKTMSKLSEYLALIPKGLPQSIQVMRAISNEIKLKNDQLPENEKNEIIRRRYICSMCPFNSVNAQNSEEYKTLTGKNYTTSRTDLHCSFCGCPINTRTSGLKSNCGAEVWNKDNSNKQIELRWKAVE